jgi:hypothetical protein
MTLGLSVRRSYGGQHEYVRPLWTRDGDPDENANRGGNGQIGTGSGPNRLCAGLDRRPEAGAPARRTDQTSGATLGEAVIGHQFLHRFVALCRPGRL